jgi:hypothetical protein
LQSTCLEQPGKISGVLQLSPSNLSKLRCNLRTQRSDPIHSFLLLFDTHLNSLVHAWKIYTIISQVSSEKLNQILVKASPTGLHLSTWVPLENQLNLNHVYIINISISISIRNFHFTNPSELIRLGHPCNYACHASLAST